MAAEGRDGASTPSLMALVSVTFYHALEIYLHRSRDSHFRALPVPAEVQRALSELMSMAYHTVATGPVQLLERFQWALLMAGTETRNPVHREWVSRNIADPSMRTALQLITLSIGETQTISMQEIRRLVSGVNTPVELHT